MREDWERQSDHLELSGPEVARLLTPAFPGTAIRDFAVVTGGKANTSLKVTLAEPDRIVLLRLFVRDADSGAKEAAILRRLGNRVPVPEVFHFVADNPVSGHAYAVLDWIEGQRMDLALTAARAEDQWQIAHAAGATVARIGETIFPSSGFLNPDLSLGETFAPGADGFLDFVRDFVARPRVRARLGEKDCEDLLAFAVREAAILDEAEGTARLTHCDYDPSNILVRRIEGRWQVAAVIDWEFAVAASPLIDLGHMLRAPWGDNRDFVAGLAEGYAAAGGALPSEWIAAAKLLDLLAWLDFLDRPGERPRLFADARAAIADTLERWPLFLAGPAKRP